MLKFMQFLKKFTASDAGAVTVDWVVLAAAVVGLSAVVGTTVKTAIDTKGNAVSTAMAAAN